MTKLSSVTRLAAVVALLGATGTASAFDEVRDKSFGDSFGNNTNVAGSILYESNQQNYGMNLAAIPVFGIPARSALFTGATQRFDASATVLNHHYTALAFTASGTARWSKLLGGPVGSGSLSQGASVDVNVFGNDTFTAGTPCGAPVCASNTPLSLSGTVARVRITLWFGFIPVDLIGRLDYSLTATLSSQARASAYLGIADSLLGSSSATADATASLIASFGACSPSCDLAVVGLGFSAKVLGVSITPSASGRLGAVYKLGSQANYNYSNVAPIKISTLDGDLSISIVGFNIPIYDWSGYSWPLLNLWNYSGSAKCPSFLNDLTQCRDIVQD